MSSLGDIQQIYSLLQEIDKLLENIDAKTRSTEKDMTKLVARIEIVERTLVRTLGLLRRFSGDENIEAATSAIIRFITTLNQLWLTMNLFMAANPWLWPLAAVGLAGGVLSMVDSYQL